MKNNINRRQALKVAATVVAPMIITVVAAKARAQGSWAPNGHEQRPRDYGLQSYDEHSIRSELDRFRDLKATKAPSDIRFMGFTIGEDR